MAFRFLIYQASSFVAVPYTLLSEFHVFQILAYMNVKWVSPAMFCLLHKAIARYHLEYASSKWIPQFKKDTGVLESPEACSPIGKIKHLKFRG